MKHETPVNLQVQTHPLMAGRVKRQAFEGMSVAEIVRLQELSPEMGIPEVAILDKGERYVIPLSAWKHCKPKAGTLVDISLPAHGPIAAAALSIAANAAAGPIATAIAKVFGVTLVKGTFAYGLATAAIGIGTSLLLSSFMKVPELGGGGKEQFALSGVANVKAKGQPYPLVCGRHRMFMPKTTSGYTSVDDDAKVSFTGRFTFGYANPTVVLENLLIGEQPITSFDDVEIEFLNVDKDQTLAFMPELDALVVERSSEEATPKAKVSNVGDSYIFSPRTVTASASIQIKTASLGTNQTGAYTFSVDVRESGGTWVEVQRWTDHLGTVDWDSPTYADGIDRDFRVSLHAVPTGIDASNLTGLGGKMAHLIGSPKQITVTKISADYQDGYVSGGWRYGSEKLTLAAENVFEEQTNFLLEKDAPRVVRTTVGTSSAVLDISFLQGLVDSNDGKYQKHSARFSFRYREVGAATWINGGATTYTERRDKPFRKEKLFTFPKVGEWEIEVTRTNRIDNDPGDQNAGTLTAVRSFREGELPSHDGIAEMAVKIRASDQLQGQLDSLNAIVLQQGYRWDGTQLVGPEPIRHPAWVRLALLTGPHMRKPVPLSRIDLDGLKAWADEEPWWTFDKVYEREIRGADAQDEVCTAGRAQHRLAGMEYQVIRENAAAPVRQLITPRNADAFTGEIRLRKPIHGIRVAFISEFLGWQEDERTVYLPGYDENTATELDALRIDGIVLTRDQADLGNVYRHAAYAMNVAIFRNEFFNVDQDFESLAVQRGDKVRLVSEPAVAGVGSGRVTSFELDGSGFLQAVETDERFPEIDSGTFTITLRTVDDPGVTFRATIDPVDDSRWVVAENAPLGSLVEVGQLVSVHDQVLDVIIREIVRSEDMDAQLVCMPAAPEVVETDFETMPTYNPVVTDLNEMFGPEQPNVLSIVSDETTVSLDGYPRVGVETSRVNDLAPVLHRLRWRTGDDLSWIEGEAKPSSTMILTGGFTSGQTVEVEIRSEYLDGLTRGWVPAGSVAALVRANVPPDVSGFQATATESSVFAKWTIGSDLGLSHVELRHSADEAAAWEAALLLDRIALPTGSVAVEAIPGKYFAKWIGKDGTESVAAASAIVTASEIETARNAAVNEFQNTTFASTVEQLTVDYAAAEEAAVAATGAAATAVDAKNIAVQAYGQAGGLIPNQFDMSTPTWTNWNTGPTLLPNDVYAGGTTAEFNVGSTTYAGLVANEASSITSGWVSIPRTDQVRVELEIELLSGGVDGAGLLADWYYSSGSPIFDRVAVRFDEMYSGPIPLGERVTLSALVDRDTARDPATLNFLRIYLMANYGGDLGPMSAKSFKVHRFQVFPMTAVEAAIKETATAVASLENGAAASYVLRVMAEGASGTVALSAFSDENGERSNLLIDVDNLDLVGKLNADWINAGMMNARHLEVTEVLKINAVNAAFSMGKLTALDETNDGAYFGRHLAEDGSTGFALHAGRTNAEGLLEKISISERGFEILNANFYRDFAQPAAETQITDTTAATTINLDPTTAKISLDIMGGGGGGAGGGQSEGDPSTAGGDGGATTVQLRDGTTVIQTWTANGGAGGDGVTTDTFKFGMTGESSPYGTGGAGGSGGTRWFGGASDPTAGDGATGYSAGGGGGGSYVRGGVGGEVSPAVSISKFDVSGLTSPNLLINVGVGGDKGPAGPDGMGGGKGAPGLVVLREHPDTLFKANVVPLEPTSVGTMSSRGPFPPLGAGMWIISSASNTDMDIARLEINDTGETLQAIRNDVLTIISSRTPTITQTNRTERSLNYQFFPME